MSPNKERAYDAMLKALRYALDELNRINGQSECVRPDVTFAVAKAIERGKDHALSY